MTDPSGQPVDHILICRDFFPEIGGAHTWMYEAYKRWPAKVRVLARDYGGSRAYAADQARFDGRMHGSLEIVRLPMEIHDISLVNTACLKQFFGLASAVKTLSRGNQVVLHTLRSFPEGVTALTYKYLFGRKSRLVTYVHGEELNVAGTSRQLTFLAKQVYQASDIIIANSRCTAESLKRFASKCQMPDIVHPGVDVDSFRITVSDKEEQRARWGVSGDATVLVTIARHEPRKNHAGVIKALALLAEKGICPVYVVASQGEETSNLKALAQRLGLGDRVLFTGRLGDKEKIAAYGAADIHIMPSIEAGPMVEGFGIVFLEAAAAGIPSICGNSGGQPEAVIHGETGLVVDGSRVADLASAIEKLIRDKALYGRMCENAGQWAKENDWQTVSEKTARLVQTRLNLP